MNPKKCPFFFHNFVEHVHNKIAVHLLTLYMVITLITYLSDFHRKIIALVNLKYPRDIDFPVVNLPKYNCL